MEKSPHAIVANCLRLIYSRRREFSAYFYEALFIALPESKRLFVNDRAKQEKMLYFALATIVGGKAGGRAIDRDIIEFGRLHANAGVKKEYFAVFGETFLAALIQFLPHTNRQVLSAAWWTSYNEVVEVMKAGMELEQSKKQLEHSIFRKP